MDATNTNTAANLAAAATPRVGQLRRNRAQAAAQRALVGKIEEALHRSPVAVVRALELLYARQTADEQRDRTTKWDNERGFSQSHAKRGSWLVTVVIAEGRAAGRPESELLRGEALEMGREIALHYSRTQLLDAAYAKYAPAPAPTFTVPTPASMGFAPAANEVTIESLAAELGDDEPEAPKAEAPKYVTIIPAKCSGCQWVDRCENGWIYHHGTEYPCAR